MALLTTGEGSLEIPDFVVAAVTRNAEFRAELVAAFLDSAGVVCRSEDGQPSSCGLSADTLLELGGILQLAYWERHGFRPDLPDRLPAYREAVASFAKRAAERANGEKFHPMKELSEQVFCVWFGHFAWDGREILQADMVLGDLDEDQLIDVMANLLWSHRHHAQRDSNKSTDNI